VAKGTLGTTWAACSSLQLSFVFLSGLISSQAKEARTPGILSSQQCSTLDGPLYRFHTCQSLISLAIASASVTRWLSIVMASPMLQTSSCSHSPWLSSPPFKTRSHSSAFWDSCASVWEHSRLCFTSAQLRSHRCQRWRSSVKLPTSRPSVK